MIVDWKSARLTKKLPVLAVTPELHQSIHEYADQHNMKLAEAMRKALYLFLSLESSESVPQNTKSVQKKRGKKARAS